jgi:hypothetical protein
MVKNMVKELCFYKVLYVKEFGKMIVNMDIVKKFLRLVNYLKENTKMVNHKVLENIYVKMKCMKDNGLMDLNMDMVYGEWVMIIMKENGNLVKLMVMVFIFKIIINIQVVLEII